jgi:hypothetical protein
MTPLKSIPPTAGQETFRQELIQLCHRHMAEDTAEALLAVAAQAVGQMIAIQDARRYDSAMIMALVTENMMAGNKHAIEATIAEAGGRQ